MLLGMGIVFSVLIILWAMLELFRVIFYEMPKKRVAGPTAPAAPAPAPAASAPAAQVKKQEDDSELIAILTAAVAAAMGTSAGGLRIRSFRRVGRSDSAWSAASRKEQMEALL